MAKDAFYFSHDSNARNDDRMIAVRMKYNMEGYGIFFAILERLRESEGYKCIKDYNMIAFDLRVSTDKVKSIVEDFGLFVFTEDGKYFYSESFNRRMIPLENTREQRRQAGLKSAKKRAEKQRLLNDRSTTDDSETNKVKESKGKKSKEDNYLEGSRASAPTPKKTLEDKQREMEARQAEFKAQLIHYEEAYGKEMVGRFYDYWSEPAKNKIKFRKELEKTWDIVRRLNTWQANDSKFNKGSTTKASSNSTQTSISGFSDKDLNAIFR